MANRTTQKTNYRWSRGAGHTFADNIDFGNNWTELLESRYRNDNIDADVWNMGINGSTVLFVEKGLLDTIIEAQPTYVILSHSGYNEALYSYIPEEDVLHPTKYDSQFSMVY